MYRNLEAEIARAGVPQKQLATAIHYTLATMSLNLNRKAPHHPGAIIGLCAR